MKLKNGPCQIKLLRVCFMYGDNFVEPILVFEVSCQCPRGGLS